MEAKEQAGLIIVCPGQGKSVNLGGLGVDFKVWGYQTGGRLAIVEHPIAPYRLVPPHTHTMEDELSYVLQGRIGVRVGDEIAEAGAGTYIYKPCNVPHTFWNPGSEPARLLEIICPAGFENYFMEIAELFEKGGKPGGPEHETIAGRYHESHFMDWVPELKQRFGLKVLGEP
ncbi:MAG: cupin domain-containing protein [Deltaproteobacteria bacterium]|nr:cupin domain-containing protein [Deltaproteobacteria bacterium]